jgi:hypothetical protein
MPKSHGSENRAIPLRNTRSCTTVVAGFPGAPCSVADSRRMGMIGVLP